MPEVETCHPARVQNNDSVNVLDIFVDFLSNSLSMNTSGPCDVQLPMISFV